MSKIGRREIKITSAKVAIAGKKVTIEGPKGKFEHVLPEAISAAQEGKNLSLVVDKITRENNMQWGLHRALLANKIKGVEVGFESVLKIVGLGFKAQLAGKKVTFSLGYSHKIEYTLPAGVDMAVDKPGQLLTIKAIDKELLGKVCQDIRAYRPPEPYKGTGIMFQNEVIRRKAGKAKSA